MTACERQFVLEIYPFEVTSRRLSMDNRCLNDVVDSQRRAHRGGFIISVDCKRADDDVQLPSDVSIANRQISQLTPKSE